MLPGLLDVDFCFDTQMVPLVLKAYIHPDSNVLVAGGVMGDLFDTHTYSEHTLSDRVRLRVVADQVHPLIATLCTFRVMCRVTKHSCAPVCKRRFAAWMCCLQKLCHAMKSAWNKIPPPCWIRAYFSLFWRWNEWPLNVQSNQSLSEQSLSLQRLWWPRNPKLFPPFFPRREWLFVRAGLKEETGDSWGWMWVYY